MAPGSIVHWTKSNSARWVLWFPNPPLELPINGPSRSTFMEGLRGLRGHRHSENDPGLRTGISGMSNWHAPYRRALNRRLRHTVLAGVWDTFSLGCQDYFRTGAWSSRLPSHDSIYLTESWVWRALRLGRLPGQIDKLHEWSGLGAEPDVGPAWTFRSSI